MTDLALLTRLSSYYIASSSSEQVGRNGNPKFVSGRAQIAMQKVPEEFRTFASAITPETLDLADFQYALTNLTIGKNTTNLSSEDASSAILLRRVLGFPNEDPESITLSFTMILTNQGPLAVTRFQPDNFNPNLAPIIFPTGLHHSVAVYLDFLQKLALETGRQIIAFDSPGVGASASEIHIDHQILVESLKTVIRATIPPNQPIVLMGHSLSTIAVKDVLYNKDVASEDNSGISNPVEKYICIAPVSWGKDDRKGLRTSRSFIFDNALSMFVNNLHLEAKKTDDVNYYFQLHSAEDRDWLNEITSTQSFPIGPFTFLAIFGIMGRQSLWDELDNPKVAVVLPDQDQVILVKKPDEWQTKGALILNNADHSAIAGREVNPEWVQQIAKVLKD